MMTASSASSCVAAAWSPAVIAAWKRSTAVRTRADSSPPD
jgi:hypothetical protein